MKTINLILIFLALLSAPIAFTISCVVGDVATFEIAGYSCLWISFIFLIIPASLITFAIINHKKIRKIGIDIAVSAISVIFILMLGISSFTVESD